MGSEMCIRDSSLGIQGRRSDRVAKQPRTAAFPLRPMAELATVRTLVAGPILVPRNPEHSLPAAPVQPQGAAGTAGTAGRSPGSTERRHGRQHEQ